jgi:hypothetical protein
MARSPGSLIAMAVAGALAAGGAAAADWEFNPTVEAGYLYDTNYRLTAPGSEIEVQGPMVDAAVELRALTPASEFSFTPRVHATYFPNQQALDATDYYGTLYWEEHGQKVQTKVIAAYAQEDVVNSELLSAAVPGTSDLGQTLFGDSGRVLVKNRLSNVSLAPSMSYEMTQRNALELAADLTDVTYDHQLPGFQVDYRSADLLAGLKTRVNETSSITTRLRAAQFDIDTQDNTRSYGLELQWDTQNVAGTQTFLRGGAQQVEISQNQKKVEWLAGAGLSRDVGRNQIFFDLSRGVGPSSAGLVITREQLRLRWTRDMTPRLQLLAGARATRDEGVDPAALFQPRVYATGDLGMQWHWQEEFSLRLTYDYTWQKFDNSIRDPATASGATASIIYQPSQRRR